jgi:hypothetical protein
MKTFTVILISMLGSVVGASAGTDVCRRTIEEFRSQVESTQRFARDRPVGRGEVEEHRLERLCLDRLIEVCRETIQRLESRGCPETDVGIVNQELGRANEVIRHIFAVRLRDWRTIRLLQRMRIAASAANINENEAHQLLLEFDQFMTEFPEARNLVNLVDYGLQAIATLRQTVSGGQQD